MTGDEQKQQAAGRHQVRDLDLEKIGEDPFTRQDKDEQDHAGCEDTGAKGPSPLLRSHVTCKLEKKRDAADRIHNCEERNR